MKTGFAVTVAMLGLIFAGTASAVPCGPVLQVGGVIPSDGCQDGAANDLEASAGELNTGSYFGFSDWGLLDRTTRSGSDAADGSLWSINYAFGGRAGTFTLASGLSSLFTDLVVVLADSGGSHTNSAIKWSAYLLSDTGLFGSSTYAWSYDNRNRVNSLTLFGRTGSATAGIPVPEPATLALMLIGLGAVMFVYRRRQGT